VHIKQCREWTKATAIQRKHEFEATNHKYIFHFRFLSPKAVKCTRPGAPYPSNQIHLDPKVQSKSRGKHKRKSNTIHHLSHPNLLTPSLTLQNETSPLLNPKIQYQKYKKHTGKQSKKLQLLEISSLT